MALSLSPQLPHSATTPTGDPRLGGASLDPHSLFLLCAGAWAAGPHTLEHMGGGISPVGLRGVPSLAPFQHSARREPNPPRGAGRARRSLLGGQPAPGTPTAAGSGALGATVPCAPSRPALPPPLPRGLPPAARQSPPRGLTGPGEPYRAGAGAGGEALALICIRYNALWWRSWLGRARPAARSSRGRGGAGRREVSGGRREGGWCPS